MSDMTIVIAEHICGRIADLDHQPELCKEAAKTLPDLLAECKRQKDEGQQADEKIHQLIFALRHKESLLDDANAKAARRQAAAIRERAIIIHIGYGDIEIEPSGDDLEIAAAALGCSPRAWLMTEERIKALDRAARFIAWADHAGHLRGDVASNDAEIIRSMLAEAKQ